MTDVDGERDDVAIEVVCPVGTLASQAIAVRPLSPFSDGVLDLLAAVSTTLIRDPAARQFPDVVTFGFWCRRASLRSIRDAHVGSDVRLGRGLVFHIAPGNVPVNFAYSLAAGLLAGNANIVRLPSARFPQVDVVCAAFETALATSKHAPLRDHIRLIRYGREQSRATAWLSAQCDVRIIWGGDETIADVRRAPLTARAFDVTFADRYSICILNAAAYLQCDDAPAVANAFYNDTYLFDQNACTAPHLVVWLGEEVEVAHAKERFWSELHSVVARKYELQAVSAIDKQTTAYRFAAMHDGCRLEQSDDNLITRMAVNRIEPGFGSWRGMCGYFTEYHARGLDELPDAIDSRYQTVSYLGFDPEDIRQLVVSHRATGVDRIVPLGQTLDFALEWDGYDLVATLSRVVTAR